MNELSDKENFLPISWHKQQLSFMYWMSCC